MARLLLAFAAFAAAGYTTPAAAESAAGLGIRAMVPEVCELQLTQPVAAPQGGVASAEVFEMCNSSRAFQVVASHRALAPGEEVRITYGGELSKLDSSGVSHLALRQGPIVQSVPMIVQSVSLTSALVISVGMAAI